MRERLSPYINLKSIREMDGNLFKIKKHISFNQLRWSDIKNGGNCGAYGALFFNYVSVLKLEYPHSPIDYSGLTNILSSCTSKEKTILNKLRETYPGDMVSSQVSFLNNELALLSNNRGARTNIKDVVDCINDFLRKYEQPSFHFIYYWDKYDRKYFAPSCGHLVLFYMDSPDELTFFDSNTGVYILEVPSAFSLQDVEKNIRNLLFYQSSFDRWFIDPSKNGFGIKYETSFLLKKENLNQEQEKLLDYIQQYPAISQSQINKVTLEEKRFLKQSFWMREKQVNYLKNNSSSHQFLKLLTGLLILSITIHNDPVTSLYIITSVLLVVFLLKIISEIQAEKNKPFSLELDKVLSWDDVNAESNNACLPK